METSRFTFVQKNDKNDRLQSNMLLIDSSGCVTTAVEMSIQEFIRDWDSAFAYEHYDLKQIMTKKEIYVVHMHTGFSTVHFTFCPKWENPDTYIISSRKINI